MNKPCRTDGKYWTGTKDFDHIQFETDLEEYIYDSELNIDFRFKEIEKQLLKTIKGNDREIFQFMEWLRNSDKSKVTCMYCEKEIPKSEIVVLCQSCTE